jgi:hypothetical protein
MACELNALKTVFLIKNLLAYILNIFLENYLGLFIY